MNPKRLYYAFESPAFISETQVRIRPGFLFRQFLRLATVLNAAAQKSDDGEFWLAGGVSIRYVCSGFWQRPW
jgi:hypothetical protein